MRSAAIATRSPAGWTSACTPCLRGSHDRPGQRRPGGGERADLHRGRDDDRGRLPRAAGGDDLLRRDRAAQRRGEPARGTHAPGLVLIYESGTIGAKPSQLPLSIGDGILAETADAVVSVPEIFNYWLQP